MQCNVCHASYEAERIDDEEFNTYYIDEDCPRCGSNPRDSDRVKRPVKIQRKPMHDFGPQHPCPVCGIMIYDGICLLKGTEYLPKNERPCIECWHEIEDKAAIAIQNFLAWIG